MTYLPPHFLDGPDRDDARLDEQRDDERALAAGLDALPRAAFTPWPPAGVDVERIRPASPSAAGESTRFPNHRQGGERPEEDAPAALRPSRLLARRHYFSERAFLAAITILTLVSWAGFAHLALQLTGAGS